MKRLILLSFLIVNISCSSKKEKSTLRISKTEYHNKLEGFWLGECIANWTGLITEMDKIGNIGDIKTGDFYTRADWGKKDQPSIWGQGVPSDLSENIDFVFRGEDEVWGADDDTDIEYIYQHAMHKYQTSMLSPEQIRETWINHIKVEEENYLWVSNQKAFDLMREGMLPPNTSLPENNEHYNMIDAQLTTEIFGLLAPARPDVAKKISYLPIRTTARYEAAWISDFYVKMHSLASLTETSKTMKENIFWMANEARKDIPDSSYVSKMYDFVLEKYNSGITWEATRDSIYQRYQVEEKDGYNITSQNIYCNGCFAAGINYAASLVSLFYGEGDLKETIKIGVLTGWDSDNPTATWGGLLGFMMGKDAIEKEFGRKFSDKFDIHRTRVNFPLEDYDNLDNMANTGLEIIDMVVLEQMGGKVDGDYWVIPEE